MSYGSRRRKALMWAGLLALATVFTIVGCFVIINDKLNPTQKSTTLVALFFTELPIAVQLCKWGFSTTAPALASPAKLTQAKEALASLAKPQWDVEALMRSLDQPAPIAVIWKLTASQVVMDHPANLAVSSLSASSDDISSLVNNFRQMSHRRLVVLGGPGTGKTTLAVQIARELLNTRSEHPDEAIPVLLSATSWDIEQFPHLNDWVAAQIARNYPALRAPEFGAEAATALAADHSILPVIDGLDECQQYAQAAIINALNWSLSGDDGLILTSRTLEYTQATQHAGSVINGAAVIEPEPLAPAVAAEYLSRCLPPLFQPRWEGVLNSLRKADSNEDGYGALAETVSRPLGLWLVRVGYCTSYGDPSPLLDADNFPDAETLRAHLYDRLIPAVLRSRQPTSDPSEILRHRYNYTSEKVRNYLSYIAHRMAAKQNNDHLEDARNITWWRLAWLTDCVTTKTYLILAALVTLLAVIASLARNLFIMLLGAQTAFILDIKKALILGLSLGIMVAWSSNDWQKDAPGVVNLSLRGRGRLFAHHFTNSAFFGLAAGMAFGVYELAVDQLLGPRFPGDRFDFFDDAVPAIVLVGIPIGVTAALMDVWEQPTLAEHSSTPNSSWQADRALNIRRLIVPAIIVAAAYSLDSAQNITTGLLAGEIEGGSAAEKIQSATQLIVIHFSIGVSYGLAFGFPILLIFGKHRAWLIFIYADFMLALSGKLPRQLMVFLDDMHNLGLLRTVGPSYQFRHFEFQDYLAETHD